MPKVTNAFTTYNAVGNREDLSNVIYNIDPFDTPVMSAIRRRNVKNRLFDWQTEFLPNVAPTVVPGTGAMDPATNAQFEGFALAPSAAQPTIRQNNVTQIAKRDATISGSQEESDAAGKGSEMSHQMAMASKVLKSDMETAICSRQPRIDGNDTGPTARVTEGITHWLARAKDKTGAVARRYRARDHRDRPADAIDGPVSDSSYAGVDYRSHGRRCDAESVYEWGVTDVDGRTAWAETYSQHLRGQKHDSGFGREDRSRVYRRCYRNRFRSYQGHSK